MDQIHQVWFYAVIPIILIACVALNLVVRARGGRSITLNLEAFGVKLKFETTSVSGNEADKSSDT